MANVKKIGNDVEREFIDLMYQKGWWVHLFASKVNGQPFDIVMAKNGKVWFLDVKSVQGKNYLLHSRIEENQKNAMTMLYNRHIDNVGFVIKFDDEWRFLRFSRIDWNSPRTPKKDTLPLFEKLK